MVDDYDTELYVAVVSKGDSDYVEAKPVPAAKPFRDHSRTLPDGRGDHGRRRPGDRRTVIRVSRQVLNGAPGVAPLNPPDGPLNPFVISSPG